MIRKFYKWNVLFLIFRDRYPYFKAEDDRWKNSVRHNLSMNPHFRKGDKSKHGAGHLWVLADFDEEAAEQGQQQGQGQGEVLAGKFYLFFSWDVIEWFYFYKFKHHKKDLIIK